MHRCLCFATFILVLMFLQPSCAFDLDGFDVVASGVDITSGYRSDRLKWSIAGDRTGQNPNVLSELSWEDLESFELQAQGWLQFASIPYIDRESQLLVDVSLGKILDGDVQDSDYAADNRTDEWSRSDNKADTGFLFGLSGGWGPKLTVRWSDKLTITPLVGYAFEMQALSMTDGQQVVSEPLLKPARFSDPPPVGNISGLDSDYTAYWHGPWLGCLAHYQVNDNVHLSMSLEYHIVSLFAQADWNLRSEFQHPVSFEHEADGTGFVWAFDGKYRINNRISALVNIKIQDWQTGSGTDRTYFADGSRSVSRLNEVEWNSYSVTSGIEYRF